MLLNVRLLQEDCVMTRGTKENLILSKQISTSFSYLQAPTITAFLGLLMGPGISLQIGQQPSWPEAWVLKQTTFNKCSRGTEGGREGVNFSFAGMLKVSASNQTYLETLEVLSITY